MSDITTLLQASERGEPGAARELFERIYDDLKKLAAQRMAREGPGHTLQPTALVNEVYLRLLNRPDEDAPAAASRWDGRRHFFAAAAEAMRRILVESARRKSRQKHGGEFRRAALDPDQIGAPELADEVLRLDEALVRFAAVEPKMAELVGLRFFGGLTLREAAEQLGIARRTADAHWAYARAWLLAEIGDGAGEAT